MLNTHQGLCIIVSRLSTKQHLIPTAGAKTETATNKGEKLF